MESVASMASLLPTKLLLLLLSPIDTSPPSLALPSSPPELNWFNLLHLIRYFLLLVLHSLLFVARCFLTPALNLTLAAVDSSSPFPNANSGAVAPRHLGDKNTPLREGYTGILRGLSHVLAVMTRIPVGSRKYDMVRSLAERLIDDNLRCGGGELEEVNRTALSVAFSRTLRRLEAIVVSRSRPGKADRRVGRILGRLRRWAEAEDEVSEVVCGDGGFSWAEKLAAELTWLAEKMAACGAAAEAVKRWGAASELARLALSAEPRLQGSFVRLSAFLFRYTNIKETERCQEREEEGEDTLAGRQMDMLMSWLPLLCCASNGTDAPVMSSLDKSEMVGVLEDIIEKLSEERQEEVLALWLHHFTSSPDSDWPNLQSGYTRWYAKSRKLLLSAK